MWKDSIRNIVVIFQPNILRIVGFYVRHSATVFLYVCIIKVVLWIKDQTMKDNEAINHNTKFIHIRKMPTNIQLSFEPNKSHLI